jgi:succinate dehydrogenase / fumarate reductase membrane anchor subunit
MSYLTDRKRATGTGSAKTGTEHFWLMKVSSVALLCFHIWPNAG